MRAKVTEAGILLPKQWFEGINEVEIRREHNVILIEPVAGDRPRSFPGYATRRSRR